MVVGQLEFSPLLFLPAPFSRCPRNQLLNLTTELLTGCRRFVPDAKLNVDTLFLGTVFSARSINRDFMREAHSDGRSRVTRIRIKNNGES